MYQLECVQLERRLMFDYKRKGITYKGKKIITDLIFATYFKG